MSITFKKFLKANVGYYVSLEWVQSLITRGSCTHSQVFQKVCSLFGGDENILTLSMIIVAHICEYSKNIKLYTTSYDFVICKLYLNKKFKTSIGLQIKSLVAQGWVSECTLKLFGMMEIFQTVIVVLVMKPHKCVKTSEPVYILKRDQFYYV